MLDEDPLLAEPRQRETMHCVVQWERKRYPLQSLLVGLVMAMTMIFCARQHVSIQSSATILGVEHRQLVRDQNSLHHVRRQQFKQLQKTPLARAQHFLQLGPARQLRQIAVDSAPIPDRIAALESGALGQIQSGALLARIDELERAVLGTVGSGPMPARLEQLERAVGAESPPAKQPTPRGSDSTTKEEATDTHQETLEVTKQTTDEKARLVEEGEETKVEDDGDGQFDWNKYIAYIERYGEEYGYPKGYLERVKKAYAERESGANNAKGRGRGRR